MKHSDFSLIAISLLFLAACAGQTTAFDPCTPENMETSVKPVNDLQREFDDTSLLASNVAREQLPALISDMQRIRRDAEDQVIPTCLVTLKSHQLAHMTTVIDTMIAFVGGADSTTLNDGIAQASQEHDQYTLEMARLMGITLVPATNAPAPSETPSP